ncbi:MAG: hypothetical protein AAFU53_03685 [Cyanobacteria bacterium J06632_3]
MSTEGSYGRSVAGEEQWKGLQQSVKGGGVAANDTSLVDEPINN